MKNILIKFLILFFGVFYTAEAWAVDTESGNLLINSSYEQRVEEYNEQWLSENHSTQRIESFQARPNALTRQLIFQIQIVEDLIYEQSDNPVLYTRLGTLKAAEGHLFSAIRQFKKTLFLNPQDEEGNFRLGYTYLLTGDRQEAIRYFKRTTIINPSRASAYAGLGSAYLQNEN